MVNPESCQAHAGRAGDTGRIVPLGCQVFQQRNGAWVTEIAEGHDRIVAHKIIRVVDKRGNYGEEFALAGFSQ